MLFFLDTNIILRHLLRDDEAKATRSKELLVRIERGEVKARTSEVVITEVVFVLERTYRVPRAKIAEYVLPIVQSRGLILPQKRLFLRTFGLYLDKNISFADAYNIALMERLKIRKGCGRRGLRLSHRRALHVRSQGYHRLHGVHPPEGRWPVRR
ncbi:MAG: PIN domain-containing protein [Chloroflexi bacterium]|nr:PIN domain-containing protein [Chloroflexota bacterium]